MEITIENTVTQLLASYPNVRQVILFGSMVSGNANSNSDLDLAIDTGAALSAEDKIQLIEELAVEIGRPIDLIDLHSVGEPLLGQILKEGRRIIGRDEDYAALIRRHVFEQADFVPYITRILKERRQAWLGKG